METEEEIRGNLNDNAGLRICDSHLNIVNSCEKLRIVVFQEHETQIKRETLHEDVSIHFLDAQCESFLLYIHSMWFYIVHKVIVGDFSELQFTDDFCGEIISTGEGDETPFQFLTPKAQNDRLEFKIIFRCNIQEVGERQWPWNEEIFWLFSRIS